MQTDYKERIKWQLWTGSIIFLILGVFAIIFYKERTCFIDLAYHSFNIIQNQTVFPQADRYGASLTQIIPLVSTYLNLSLKSILVSYSLSFVFVNFVFFILSNNVFKQPKIGLCILLFSCFQQHSFYWAQSELPQGINFLFFSLAIVSYLEQKPFFLKISTLFLIAICGQTFHPLMLPIYLFLIVYFYLNKQKSYFLLMIINLIFYLIKKVFVATNGYDQEAISKLNNLKTTNIFSDLYTNFQTYFSWIKSGYFIYGIAFLVVLYLVFKINRWYCVVLFFGVIIYSYVIIVAYKDLPKPFYFENLMLPVLAITIIVYCTTVDLKQRYSLNYVTCLVGLCFLFATHTNYTKRLDWHTNYLNNTNTPAKALIWDSCVNSDNTIMNWGLGYELLLLQTINNDSIKKLAIVIDDSNKINAYKNLNKSFIGNWKTIALSELNSQYFKISDTAQYQLWPCK